MFTTAAALVGVFLVTVLAVGPVVIEMLPEPSSMPDDLAAAWDHPHAHATRTADVPECVLAA